jgi:hypothetical protein
VLLGCTAHQYTPSPHYLTIHKNKGEVVANLYVMPAAFQAGYSISNHFFVYGSGFYKMRNSGSPNWGRESNRHQKFRASSSELTFGTGYFIRSNNFHFQLSAGGGFGKLNYEHTIDLDNDYRFTVNAKRDVLFAEPLVAVVVNDHLEMGLFAKFNSMRFYDLVSELDMGDEPSVRKDDLPFAAGRPFDVKLSEPGFFLTAGWQNIKFNFHIGGVTETSYTDIRYKPFFFRTGMSIRIGNAQDKAPANSK